MTVREIVKEKLHTYFLEKLNIEVDMKKEYTPTVEHFDLLDLVEIEMDMNKHFGISMDYEFHKWDSGTIKDIIDSIEVHLKK